MARNFALDPKAAREANTGGKRITESGKYVGTIIAAFYESNQNGTESMNIMFKADSGQEAGPLTIYTHNGRGEALAGYKLVNALMTCCKVKGLTAKQMPVALYDYDAQAVVTKQKECYQELMGKRVGLFLQAEEYEKQRTSGVGERMIIFAPFEPSTALMAAEILDKKTQPELIHNVSAFLEKNPIRKLRKSTQNSSYQAASDFQAPPHTDDDIPWD